MAGWRLHGGIPPVTGPGWALETAQPLSMLHSQAGHVVCLHLELGYSSEAPVFLFGFQVPCYLLTDGDC